MSSLCKAALINRDSGLIHDDVLDITWMQIQTIYAPMATIYMAMLAMESPIAFCLIYSLNFDGYDDLHLPNTTTISDKNYDLGLSYDVSNDRL